MKVLWAPVLVLVLVPVAGPSEAGEWEASLFAGPTFPFYEQSFEFDPGPIGSPAGTTITQEGVFRLEGNGGISLGAALAFHPRDVIGIEARLDTADVDVSTLGARYRVRAALPPPIGTLSSEVAFTGGEGNLERLRPMSLNLRLRSPGALGVSASAGFSFLPGFRFVIRQPVEAAFGDSPLVRVGEVSLPAEALPSEEGDGRLGWNAGGGVHWHVAPRVRLQAEGRYFRFRRQTLYWAEPQGTGALDVVPRQLVREIASRLEPVRFNPTFFQATGGVSLIF